MEQMIRWLLIFLAVLFLNGLNFATAQNTNQLLQPTTDSLVNYTLYITFDDGPLEGSEDINDAVKKEDIKVNVFIVGKNVLSNARMKRFYGLYQNNPFIEIGNHSFSHAHDR
ncbi:MAG: polysaccharide deacetylase family protein [Thermodesulfobacteriota bacterium]|jgi:peptidoglycan/xylan/chitin deacetylase (PgdA/CDA1 family)|nr:MAG: polysaccharide deacetylase family protein [Thermodesulfobacteriota bacterium]